MDETLIGLLCILLILVGIIGTILPVLPGLLLCYGGLLIYKFGTSTDLHMAYIWIFGLLTLLSIILNYVIPARTNKKYGGTRWGSIGSVIGTLAGFILIPTPFGFLIGMILGVFLAELIHDRTDKKKAWNSAKGAFIGFLYGTGYNFIVGASILCIVIYDLLF